jgi:hypothetical protein
MGMSISALIDKLVILFSELSEILENDNEKHWTRRIKECLRILQSKEVLNDKTKLTEVKSIYHSIHIGYSGFSEYFLWREDFDERVKANKMLDEIRDEIWNILEKIN